MPLFLPAGAHVNSVRRVALVTGGTSGLGLAIARELIEANYDVFIVSRDYDNLVSIASGLAKQAKNDAQVRCAAGDVTNTNSVNEVVQSCHDQFGRLDLLVNCVGASDRGTIAELTCERLDELMRVNVHSALLCSQAALPMLRQSKGVIINIGSLASKVGARYLGGYAIVKHALAGMTQQMRLELRGDGVHVGIVCCGPIRRDDAGTRYRERVSESLPTAAAAPGAGAKLKGLDPQVVAKFVRRCAERRLPEVILPGHLRLLIAIGNALPRLGDWLLLRFTSSKSSRKAD